ncbi:hypothetical protein BX600DRAFT_69596 [Xylariales sp. PMI_506]|nr:hypothetical protein BX600DRAFT_69596 [Xylariales sp. PMI_506]
MKQTTLRSQQALRRALRPVLHLLAAKITLILSVSPSCHAALPLLPQRDPRSAGQFNNINDDVRCPDTDGALFNTWHTATQCG